MARSLNADRLASELDRRLKAAGDATRAVAEKRYLKSDLAFYGVGLPSIRAALRDLKLAHPILERKELRQLVQELWKRPAFECRITAVLLLDAFCEALKPADITLIERLLRESKTWALVDELAGVVVGSLVERFPKLGGRLDRWAADENFWLRRSAMLALLRPLRRGVGDFDRFTRYADRARGGSDRP